MAIELTFIDPIPPSLPSPGRSLLFDVTGVPASGVTILAEYNTGAYEVVHDGAQFSQVYAAQSSRNGILDGFQYLVKRAGGWFGDSVTIRTVAASAADGDLGMADFSYSDDFAEGIRAAASDGPNDTLLVSGGTVTTPDGGTSPQVDGGLGWAKLEVPDVALAEARIFLRNEIVVPRSSPLVFQARVILPADPAVAFAAIGLKEGVLTSYAYLTVDTGGFWVTSVKSASGGSSNDTVRAAAVAGGTYDVRITLVAGTSAQFSVQQLGGDVVDLGTESTVNTIPGSSDQLAPVAVLSRIAGADTFSVDWWNLTGGR